MANCQRERSNFSQVPNTAIQDSRLSMRAKGIYAYIYSKPDNWNFSTNRIAEDCTECVRTIKTTVQELESAGYLHRHKQANGRVIYHLQVESNPECALCTKAREPECKIRTVQNTHSAECAPLYNTVEKSNTVKTNNIKEKYKKEKFSNPKEFFNNPKLLIDYMVNRGEQKTSQLVKNIEDFISYWTEANYNTGKQRWQTQPTFDVQRRLNTWMRNTSKFNSTNQTNTIAII